MPIRLNSSGGGAVTIDVPSTASTFTLTAPARTGNIITSADSATVTQGMLGTNVVGNGPAFACTLTSAQTLPPNTFTKVLYNNKQFDTANAVSSSRFTPSVAGYYLITVGINATTGPQTVIASIFRNGTEYRRGSQVSPGTGANYGSVACGLVYLNGSTDYVEGYGFVNASSSLDTNGIGNFFDGFLARAA